MVTATAAPGQQSDRELVERVAGGDRAAVRLLFMRHHARIYRFVARQTGSEMMADDIANEVFLELWRQAPAFQGRSEVSTWLLGIARFKALSALRKKKEVEIDEEAAAARQGEDAVHHLEIFEPHGGGVPPSGRVVRRPRPWRRPAPRSAGPGCP